MTGTNHVLTGVVIGLTVGQPAVALPLALGSHFVMDALPHYGDPDVTSKRFLTILGLEAIAIMIIFASILTLQPSSWLLAIACGFIAAAPDFMWLPNFLRDMSAGRERRPYTNPVTRFHKHIQWAEKPYNWPYDAIWLAVSVLVVAKLV